MTSEDFIDGSPIMDASVSPCNGCLEQHHDKAEENENLGVDLLNDFDSYWDDIGDRLTVSRMVSDSVIKGMVGAIQQEAAWKVAEKELELARLKETLCIDYHGTEDNGSIRCPMTCLDQEGRKKLLHPNNLNCTLEHEKLQNSLHNLKVASEKQFKNLEKEIYKIRRNASGSELSGLSDILQEKRYDKWIDVDRIVNDLRTTLEAICAQMEEAVIFSRSTLSDWQQERELQAEIEGIVMKSCILSLKEEFEHRLWDQNAQFYGNESANWLEKRQEISSLRQELDALSKSLSVPESGQLISHGSLEHRKASSNHVSTTSVWEGNGKHDESIIVVPENLDHAQLKHFSKDELFNYFKTEMTKMKRQYESKEHEMTEEYFSLKREYLKERGLSLPVRKDKEFDTLRKRIPEVIQKLDNILTENEKLPLFSMDAVPIASLKDRLESLGLENQQLRDLLTNRKKEIKCLTLQVSNAAEKARKHSLAEMLESIKNTADSAEIEASICDDLYKFLLKEVVGQIRGFSEELEMEYDMMQGVYEIMLKEAIKNAEPAVNVKFDDSAIESIITEGLCEVVFRESLKEAEEEVVAWNQKYVSENEARLSLEMAALENKQALRLNSAEKEKLEQEMLLLSAMVNDNSNLLEETTGALAKEKEKYEFARQELENLTVLTMHQQRLIEKYDGESQMVKGDLDKALQKIEMDKEEISKLREQLEILTKKLAEVLDEKNVLLSVSQEHQNNLASVEAREREQMQRLTSTIVHFQGFSEALKDFEKGTIEDIKILSLRLEKLSYQFSSLIQGAKRLRRTGFLYKQKLERTTSNLQKAEAEVDLLGDEVDTLLSLLEKIYIALDHYAPILQHYPGIMEILKLVRRELSGES